MQTAALASRPSIGRVQAVRLGSVEIHREHVYGTRKPALWWILFGRDYVRVPINVFVIEHARGLVLFDTGQDRAVVTDPHYFPDPVTRFFCHRLFRWHLGPQDTLTTQLERAGAPAADVRWVVLSHLHADHVGGIGEVLQADLYASEEGLAFMRGNEHPERATVYRDRIELPGARWNALAFVPTDDPELAPFEEAFDLMGDGSLVVLPTPGHLAGSVSLFIRSPGRPPLLCVGDLTYREELLRRDQLPATGDRAALLASFEKVRAFQRHHPRLVILPTHDPLAADNLRAAGYDVRPPGERAPQTSARVSSRSTPPGARPRRGSPPRTGARG